MTDVKSYCPICDNYGGTHAPCLGCGKYFKTGVILGGISPVDTPEAPVRPPESLDDRIKINHHVRRPMPDTHSWDGVRRLTSHAICEQARYLLLCKRSFTKITYFKAGQAPIDVYLCQACGSQFFTAGIEQVLDKEDGS